MEPINAFHGGNNPLLPTHPRPSKKTNILSGNSWFVFLSTVSIWDMDSVSFSFPACLSVSEAVEKKTGVNMIISLRPSQVLCCIRYNRNLRKFPWRLWRCRCVTETWLPRAPAMWSSNGANDVCSVFNFMSASLWDKPGSEKANNIIRLACISPAWKGISLVMAGGVSPRLLVPQLILTEDQIILLDLVTPSRNSVLISSRTVCILEAMTIWFLCVLSFTIDSVKMFKDLPGTVIF